MTDTPQQQQNDLNPNELKRGTKIINGVKIMQVAINLIIAFAWTAALSWICGKGFTGVSWFLVLVPYIIMLLVFFKITKTISSNSQIMMVIPPAATQQMM